MVKMSELGVCAAQVRFPAGEALNGALARMEGGGGESAFLPVFDIFGHGVLLEWSVCKWLFKNGGIVGQLT